MKQYNYTIWFAILLLLSTVAIADEGHPGLTELEQGEAILNAQIPCEDLSEVQLEQVGDYIMEQMHPGEAHEIMDEQLGGHGSQTLKQAHINMAQVHYCRGSQGMGMMRNNFQQNVGGTNMMWGTGYPMMGSGGWLWMGLFWLLWIAIAAFVFGIIFWWTKKLMKKR